MSRKNIYVIFYRPQDQRTWDISPEVYTNLAIARREANEIERRYKDSVRIFKYARGAMVPR